MADDKFCQSRRGYLWLAVNVLRNTLKIKHIIKEDLSQIKVSQSDEKNDESALMQILQMFETF